MILEVALHALDVNVLSALLTLVELPENVVLAGQHVVLEVLYEASSKVLVEVLLDELSVLLDDLEAAPDYVVVDVCEGRLDVAVGQYKRSVVNEEDALVRYRYYADPTVVFAFRNFLGVLPVVGDVYRDLNVALLVDSGYPLAVELPVIIVHVSHLGVHLLYSRAQL